MHSRQKQEECESFPGGQFKSPAQALGKEGALQDVYGNNDEKNLAQPAGGEQEPGASGGQVKQGCCVAAEVACKEHPQVCCVVGGEGILACGVDVGVGKHAAQVAAHNEGQEHKADGDHHAGEALPGSLVVAQEYSAKNRQKKDHLELGKECQGEEHGGVLDFMLEVDAIESRYAENAGEKVHLSPHGSVKQKCWVEGYESKNQVGFQGIQL